MVHRYAVYLSMSLRERLQLVLADLGARFGVQDARGVLLTPELAQEELAEMIGSSRPMVSKLLSEMAERSMIACQGRRYILLRGSGLEVPAQRLLCAAPASREDRTGAANGYRTAVQRRSGRRNITLGVLVAAASADGQSAPSARRSGPRKSIFEPAAARFLL